MTMPKGWSPADNKYMDGDLYAQLNQAKYRRYSDDGKPLEVKKKIQEPKILPKMGTGTYELVLGVSVVSMCILVILASLLTMSYLVGLASSALVGPCMLLLRWYMRTSYDIRRNYDGCYRD